VGLTASVVGLNIDVVLPKGPRERLILALISLQALIFLRTTYSKPEKCLWPWGRERQYLFEKVVKAEGGVEHCGAIGGKDKL
jgi:hypothetical protein